MVFHRDSLLKGCMYPDHFLLSLTSCNFKYCELKIISKRRGQAISPSMFTHPYLNGKGNNYFKTRICCWVIITPQHYKESLHLHVSYKGRTNFTNKIALLFSCNINTKACTFIRFTVYNFYNIYSPTWGRVGMSSRM